VFLVCISVISINGAPADVTTTTEAEFEVDVGEPSEPFNPEQYKQYLLDLKCMDVIINHGGTKTPEVQSSSIYQPTTTTERSSDQSPVFEDAFGDKPDSQKETVEVADEAEKTKVNKAKRSTETESSTSTNNTSEVNKTEVCTAPLTENWDSYNWYQVRKSC